MLTIEDDERKPLFGLVISKIHVMINLLITAIDLLTKWLFRSYRNNH